MMRGILAHVGALVLSVIELLLMLAITIWSVVKPISERKATGFGFVLGGIPPWIAALLAALVVGALYAGNLWLIRRFGP